MDSEVGIPGVGVRCDLSVKVVYVIVVADVQGLGFHHLSDQLIQINLLVHWS